MKVKGFRRDLEDYYNIIIHPQKPTVKMTSPFIVVLNEEIHAVHHIEKLMEYMEYNDEALIFHVWVGKWRSDVFHYKLKELKELMKENDYMLQWT